MKAFEWIDRAKSAAGIDSDYGIAKLLGIHRATVSNYRASSRFLDEDIAIKIANVIGVKPEAVLIDQLAERTKEPQARSALFEMAQRVCILCLIANARLVVAVRPFAVRLAGMSMPN